MWDFHFHIEAAGKPSSIVVIVDKEQKTAVVIDVVILPDSNIGKKEHKKMENQVLKKHLEQMWKVKSKVVLVVIEA